MKRRAFLHGAAISAAAAPLAAPAIAQSRKEMTIVSTWPRDFPGLGTSAQRLAAQIEKLTDGGIVVEYYAAGERVGAFDAFDETASGNAQAYIGADYYWKGKHPGWAFFAAVPFGLTYPEMDAWIKFGGGQELWDELGDEFGLKNFACGNTGDQAGGWFNKELNSPSDFEGLKVRIPGMGGDVLAKLGASPVSLPGAQIFENLVSGALDAAEWVGPYNDYFMKFYEAAKYYYWPGMHEPNTQFALGMNRKFYDSLSATEKLIVKAACDQENAMQIAEANANNGEYLDKLVNEHGVEVREINDDLYDAMGEAAAEVYEETRDQNDLTKRIHDSYTTARSEIGGYLAIADVAYLNKRNRVLGIGDR